MVTAQWKPWVWSQFYIDKSDKITEWGTQASTPLQRITLDLYWLADHKHEVIRSTPEADGIAPLYSNSQKRGRVCPLCALFIQLLFHICPLQTPQKALAQQICCISQIIQSTFIPLLSPFVHFCFVVFSASSVSLPSFPVHLLGTLHIQR